MRALIVLAVAAHQAEEVLLVVDAQRGADRGGLLPDFLGHLLFGKADDARVAPGVVLDLKAHVKHADLEDVGHAVAQDILADGEQRELSAVVVGGCRDRLEVFHLEAVVHRDGDALALRAAVLDHRQVFKRRFLRRRFLRGLSGGRLRRLGGRLRRGGRGDLSGQRGRLFRRELKRLSDAHRRHIVRPACISRDRRNDDRNEHHRGASRRADPIDAVAPAAAPSISSPRHIPNLLIALVQRVLEHSRRCRPGDPCVRPAL